MTLLKGRGADLVREKLLAKASNVLGADRAKQTRRAHWPAVPNSG